MPLLVSLQWVCRDVIETIGVYSQHASGGRALHGGKLENARIVEALTALLIGLNIRYKVHGGGIRFTGLPSK